MQKAFFLVHMGNFTMVGKQTNVARVAEQSEVNRLMRLDTTPWYRKPNLRRLYLFLMPSVLGCEMTSGYDGSILNGLQAVQPWLSCTLGLSSPFGQWPQEYYESRC